MSEVTKPMALDETLQDVADALDNLTEGYAGESAYEAAVSGGYTMPQSQFEADTQAVRWRSNPNLLDNWYFVGGGDQQGGGQLPVNQRKQTSYVSSANFQYSVDRWQMHYNARPTVSLQSDGLHLVTTAGNNFAMYQALENPAQYSGHTITFTSLLSGNAKRVAINVISDDGSVSTFSDAADFNNGLATVTAKVPTSNVTRIWCIISQEERDIPIDAVIKAVKLELGSEQTLAHKEKGVWVLNEIPDYTTQLLRCQRFYRVFTSTSASTTGYGYSTNSKNLRPEMRATPSTGSFTYDGTTYYYLNANL